MSEPSPAGEASDLAAQIEAIHARAACAVAERDGLADALPALQQHRAAAERHVDGASGGAMARLAMQLGLDAEQIRFVWTAAALAVDPRVALHAEALGGSSARRGLSVALYARISGCAPDAARELAIELARGNPLVTEGLLVADDAANAVMRCYAAPARLLAHLRGDATPDGGLRIIDNDGAGLLLDEHQRTAIAELAKALVDRHALAVVEGPLASGRTTAIAAAARSPIVVLDARHGELATRLGALRREAVLAAAIPVIANVDRVRDTERGLLGAFLRTARGSVVVTSALEDFDPAIDRPVIRVRWRVAEAPMRRRLWERFAGAVAGDLEDVATRFRVGPGTMARAVRSARIGGGPLDASALVAGLRHNIGEELGGLARRVEVTQGWDDLVLAPDTLAQVQTLISRVRHAHRVLEQWRYRGKLARGTGVPALFSGPPGTGKTMVAGLIARELELDLYQVDLSQIVSKWIGETEKQLARVFDAAEQGHGLLLFDEADALFGQRSADVRGAVDRYANLEVNYLLQRVESFGGITILTTNLDQSIDRALKRRLAAHIVFELPDEDERIDLWRRLTATDAAPLARDLDPTALARQFPKMSGANIRNAALAAAFLAAAEGAPTITQATLERAARGEYRSMGFVLSERRV